MKFDKKLYFSSMVVFVGCVIALFLVSGGWPLILFTVFSGWVFFRMESFRIKKEENDNKKLFTKIEKQLRNK